MKTWIIALGAILLAASPAIAQQPTACLAVDGGPNVLEGRLTRRTFAGPPNYEDVRRGDTPERTFILVLPSAICIDDGQHLADPHVLFRDVQVYANDAATRRRLSAAVGRRLRVSGEPFAAHTGHHHAPLVMEVRRLTMLPARRSARR